MTLRGTVQITSVATVNMAGQEVQAQVLITDLVHAGATTTFVATVSAARLASGAEAVAGVNQYLIDEAKQQIEAAGYSLVLGDVVALLNPFVPLVR